MNIQPHRSAPMPPTTPRRQRSLPPSLPSFASSSLLFHRTLRPRISKHHDLTRTKIKTALELELKEERLREAAGLINFLSTSPQPDINNSDEKGRTPLHFACAGGHYKCVQILIERKANVNAIADVAGNRPLHLAVISNKMECVIALLEAGAKIYMNDAFHRTPLSVARSRLRILMNNIFKNSSINSENIDVEEIAKDNKYIFENREIFDQVLQIIKILRHYLILENREGNNIQGSENIEDIDLIKKNFEISPSNTESSTISAMEALDDLTSQLSQLAITKSDMMKDVTSPCPVMLSKVQNVLDNIIKYQI
ncbi:6256_t:CDS:2 [Diversispora eburnea]|uniref:6256_t:CDS:1 n=1 Tax=Diversispora eburnea TaxID=1213867 RepID=A0A9N9A970_9GLOM|nr:6256_t:CDS:2 [Diversispora eburnea]